MTPALIVAFALFAVWVYLFSFRTRFPDESYFEAFDTRRTPERWPTLSVILPARNEAGVLPFTLPTVLSFYYPYVEVILVDDCSEDTTAAVAEQTAASHPAAVFRLLRGSPTPPGWRGKPWALQQGVEASNGEWLLFTDADIFFQPAVARDLVRLALHQQFQMASLLVLFRTESFWDRLLIPAFFFFFHLLYPFHRVRNARSRTAAAAGGCLLVERAALERAGGLAAIRDAWIDDVALGRLLKRSGACTYLGATVQAACFRRYGTLRSLRTMVVRSAFTQLRHSWAMLVLTLAGLGFVFGLPPVGMALVMTGIVQGADLFQEYLLSVASGMTLGLMILAYHPALRLYRLPVIWGLTLPVAVVVYAWMTIESAVRHALGGGPKWKGRTGG